MKFSSISIKNFRSIGNEPLVIEFDKIRNISALIGANNSGKTNILDAVGMVLGSSKFSKYYIQESDFHNSDTNNEIEIIIRLADPLIYRNVYQNPCEINKFTFTAKKYKVTDQKGKFKTEHYCGGIDGKGNAGDMLMESDRMYKEKKTADDADITNRKLPLDAQDHLYKLGYVYYLEPHRVLSFYDLSKGPLGRLFHIYKQDFPKTGNQYKGIVAREAFNSRAEEIREILKTDKLKEIEAKLLENLSKYLGLEKPPADFEIHLGLPAPEQFIDSLIQLLVKENQNLNAMNILKLGSGYLSLFRLAAL